MVQSNVLSMIHEFRISHLKAPTGGLAYGIDRNVLAPSPIIKPRIGPYSVETIVGSAA